ncbi:hypothetical protein Taro_034312 [Colocasia esculenta]|uniref:Pectinesterase n=1 Tax=Colocasia esculenta TaxID=4460 RepID=A0A843W2L0_COLES|nr:hypothetical protein [Colocasia esculenta]
MSSKGYGQVEPSGHQSQRKKRMAVAGMSAVLLVAMVVGVAVTASRGRGGSSSESSGNNDGEMSATVKAIDTICQPTDYKEACVQTLTKEARANDTDPSDLFKLAFNVAIEQVKKVFNESAVKEKAEKDPRAAFALRNCQELLEYSMDDLQNSVEQLGPFDPSKLNKLLQDLKVWLSAAITYEETCLDGFENTTGPAGEEMRKAMNLSMELTHNTLAIVDDVASLLTAFKVPSFNRRLLSEGHDENALAEDGAPLWVDDERRQLLAADVKPDAVVATDGSGGYKTIKDALAAVPKKSTKTFVIYIKAGVYKEAVVVDKSLTNVMMVGDGQTKTRITGNLNFIDGTPTFKTSTVSVMGDGFIAKDIGFENAAGAAKHQAVALRVSADKSIFYRCQMDAYQDTLYTHTKRQFYRECTVSGTIDFIFGNAPVVFQNCLMLVRQPLPNQQNIVTAQGRKDRREPTAIILQNCTISADAGFAKANWAKNPSYLGRPWKEYSRTFVLQSQINDVIHPNGWLPWMGDFGLRTCFYAEFDNRGPGAGTTQRVAWRGIKKIDYAKAQQFTAERFIQGNSWIRPTGIPFIPGLLPASTA